MDEKPLKLINQAKEQYIEKIADNMRTYGVSTTVGRVLGIIYMNRKPMTLDELSAATGMSKTRMSQVVREMLDINIAEKVFEKGVRKDIYDVESDYYETFISIFTSNWRKTINRNKIFEKKLSRELSLLKEHEELSPEVEASVNELLKEMKVWSGYYQWLTRLVDFFESGEIFEHVPKS
ncbi:GbsR/MarR family transcriptional regulator [Heyndrickxia sporothermodurans]|uniref:HTH-type transcriptional regulator n=2 Tax=Heyndrickxia TaxID=2837504 RepID=A0AB37HHV9_9BACI|nr:MULTISPECIES: GbsR/MarR family transcriptional regulator [Heyndrickxia]MBL5771562.1 GbsR/MarR family transcriptional regulator [Heyndrickxia sporothermodurans]MBL5774785.1 GbsR/MarR family transcriptional regulator [Heyndrickxia sporothermodurans]MBL5793934.1 GbsR/MarR family transcriptional regulator [Heyndrickxia sporothermodurans]MBL5796091.1 GbsR/MarR family transcriptional regulator [Heyndrickxia sporothermodurans]MBL5806998.1 GbsR/MarR family transcriptional regulator [Heyndrickxia sp